MKTPMENPGIELGRQLARQRLADHGAAYRKEREQRESELEAETPKIEVTTPSGQRVAVGGMTAAGAEKIAAEITMPAGPRLGRFRVDSWLLDELNPVIGAFLRSCYVVSAIPNEERGYVEYIAEHPDFQPYANDTAFIPLYRPQVKQALHAGRPDGCGGNHYTVVTYTWVVGDPVKDPVRP